MFNVVLVAPEIPQNTGNVSRTCAVTGCALHLVKPLGFSIDDRQLKRAGLDYWDKLDLTVHESFDGVVALQKARGGRFFLASTHAKRTYTEPSYREGDFLIFGRETAGLGEALLSAYPEEQIHIPMRPTLRSLNLSNSVAIVVYEVLRQMHFPGMD